MQRCEKKLRFGGVGGEHVHADHRIGFVEGGRRTKLRAIHLQRRQQIIRREVRGERERQAHCRRELRGKQRRAEQLDRHVQARAEHRAHVLAFHWIAEETLQLRDVVGERFSAAHQIAAQSARGGLIGAGSAAETEIDTPREQSASVPNCSVITSGA